MQTNYEAEQLSMFGQDLWYGKMFPAPLVQERQRAKTSESFWRRSSALSAVPFMSLDLTPGHGNLLGESYWKRRIVLHAQYWGVAQRRKRIFLVADFAGRTADKILFIPEGMFGDPTPSF